MAITQEQLKNRKNYYGGSDLPIILGISPFKTTWELFEEKAGISESKQSYSLYTEVGNIVEPKVQELYKVTNMDDKEFVKEFNSIHLPLIGHIDGMLNEQIVEIKASTKKMSELKKLYMPQMQFYMLLAKVKECKLIAYDRTDQKPIINNLLHKYALHYLHEFEDENHPAMEELRTELANLEIKKGNCKTTTIKFDPEYTRNMLEKLKEFDRLVKLYKDNPFNLKEIMQEFSKTFNLEIKAEEVFESGEIEEIIKIQTEIKNKKEELKPLEKRVKEYFNEKAKNADGNIIENEKIKINVVKSQTKKINEEKLHKFLAENNLELPDDVIDTKESVRTLYTIK